MGILTFVGPVIDHKGDINGACLLRWASKRARRVCHSTMAAETLSASGAYDYQAGLRFRLEEVEIYPRSVMLTDCRSLFDHIYAMTGKTAELLLPDIHELREASMPWRNSLSEDYIGDFIEMWWTATHRQLADNLTKHLTPSTKEFFKVLQTNKISLGEDYQRPRPTQRAHSFHVLHEIFFSWVSTLVTFWGLSDEQLLAQGVLLADDIT